MTKVKFTLDPANPPELTEAQRARLHAMTDAEIAVAALTDRENPPSTPTELASAFRPASIRETRERLGLSQAQFARRYAFNLRTLQEWEQSRRVPDQVARAYLKVIAREPEIVARSLVAA